GKRAFTNLFKFILPLILLVAVFNTLFADYGETVMFSILNKSIKLEPLFYGICQGVMLTSIILWFSAYTQVVTSERFLSIFGRIAPSCAMVFSLVLSFLPRLRKNAEEISDARKNIDDGNGKLKHAMADFSALISITLEDSIEVSNSMMARGYNKNRKPYSKYRFKAKDGIILTLQSVGTAIVIIIKVMGKVQFIFEPAIINYECSITAVILFAFLAITPTAIDLTEDLKWFYLKQKA
ncbi:MAG: energy-coupling factor transporter transmembrane protein EcfT, partial [Clostridiales bacterium]|nr:energy-coupling factor transporter transmembrane protein EcfT [Clostridiales bacterium]